MNLFNSIGGMVEIEVTSADMGNVLSAVNKAGITIHSAESITELTLRMIISKKDFHLFQQIISAKGCDFIEKKRIGIFWFFKNLLRRPILITGILLLAVAAVYLPGRIFFVQVDGNIVLPDRLILSCAEECGIRFGASREEIRSEKVKNGLLALIPELQWAGVNTKGCVAVISVREKTEIKNTEIYHGVSSIIADRDGVIVSCTTEQGNALCSVGQAVREGQILISGFTDCGLSIRACRSIGEVYAQTNRQLSVMTPCEYKLQRDICGTERKFSIIIGKKRINFYKDSGILGVTYDKMSVENHLTLPGGFVLPVTVITEFWTSFEVDTAVYPQEAVCDMLEEFSHSYLMRNMVAGQLLQKDLVFSNTTDACYLSGSYACLEMIGREIQEEIMLKYGKSN